MSSAPPGTQQKPIVKINLKSDTLNWENPKFDQRPLTRPLFLNSLPKSGSHLLRNIFRMFVPVPQQYDVQFIQHQQLLEHAGALTDPRNLLSWGHLMFNDMSAVAVGTTRQIVLTRDPYDWVLARARFFISDEFQGFELLKEGSLSVEAILNMMIFGIQQKAPPLASMYTYHVIGWLGTGAHLVRYEDLIAALKKLDSDESEDYFRKLLAVADIDLPEDWRERVRIGSDPKQSGTARENLSGRGVEMPSPLPDLQKEMVNFAAPGLRKLLGYA